MIDYEIKIKTIRLSLITVAVLVFLFAIVELHSIPALLQRDYLISRLVFQIPAIGCVLALTYTQYFKVYKQFAYFLALIVVALSNLHFIMTSWELARYSFPYEGLILYTIFAFFVVRLDFKLALVYALFTTTWFGLIVLTSDIYGAQKFSNFAFLATVNLIGLIGLLVTKNTIGRASYLTNKLEALSMTDQLSGLLNRRAYEKEAANVFSSVPKDKTVSVFLIDIDDFKKFNDKYGHIEGDHIIKAQSDMLKQTFKRSTDIIGRYGGEEFIVIAPEISIAEAKALADKINHKWAEFNESHDQYDDLYCSIGHVFARCTSKNFDLQTLILKADKALYEAKAAGKKCYKTVNLSEAS